MFKELTVEIESILKKKRDSVNKEYIYFKKH